MYSLRSLIVGRRAGAGWFEIFGKLTGNIIKPFSVFLRFVVVSVIEGSDPADDGAKGRHKGSGGGVNNGKEEEEEEDEEEESEQEEDEEKGDEEKGDEEKGDEEKGDEDEEDEEEEENV